MAADKSPDNIPKAIKNHKPQQTYEMKGPGGSSIRKDAANQTVAQDQKQYDRGRAEKYANVEKKAIVEKQDVREQNKGKLSPEFTTGKDKGIER